MSSNNDESDNLYELDPVADPIDAPRNKDYGGDKYSGDLAYADFLIEGGTDDKDRLAELKSELEEIVANNDDDWAVEEAKILLTKLAEM